MQIASRIVVGVAAFVAVILAITYIAGGISMLTAPFRGEVDKRERVEADGAYRIAAYDEFQKLCGTIQSKNEQIEILRQEMDTTTDPDRQAQLQSGITAHQNTRSELINEYNTKAASDYTRGQFRDSDLPYRIDPTAEEVACSA